MLERFDIVQHDGQKQEGCNLGTNLNFSVASNRTIVILDTESDSLTVTCSLFKTKKENK